MVKIFGVINASPDSVVADSVVGSPAAAARRAHQLIEDGAYGIDVGGQGSTDSAELVSWRLEWSRLATIIPALARLDVPLSIDSWKPEVVRCALQAGANTINAADGMQQLEMWHLAAEYQATVVIPFLSGSNPATQTQLHGDPMLAMVEFFERQLRTADRFDLRRSCILDPGIGFAPRGLRWTDRRPYQLHVLSHLSALRRFDLPLYVALPWESTPDHNELIEISLAARPDYVRAHYPQRVRERWLRGCSGSDD